VLGLLWHISMVSQPKSDADLFRRCPHTCGHSYILLHNGGNVPSEDAECPYKSYNGMTRHLSKMENRDGTTRKSQQVAKSQDCIHPCQRDENSDPTCPGFHMMSWRDVPPGYNIDEVKAWKGYFATSQAGRDFFKKVTGYELGMFSMKHHVLCINLF
jgi:hypothetical protein